METYHINTRVTKEGALDLPKFPFKPGEDVEVFVRPVVEDEDRKEEKALIDFGMRQFIEGYAEEDSIYDDL